MSDKRDRRDQHELSRRGFIKIGGGSAALALIPAAGLIGYVPPVAAAAEVTLKVLDEQQSRLLLSVVRTLFPHDFLSDAYYMKVVAALDSKAAEDAQVAETLRQGLASLPSGFRIMAEAAREGQLRTMEDSAFFKLAHNETMLGLYSDPEVWKIFGYEGPSVEHGGYINRGFDDLNWLPNS